ncbi:MAG: alpha/beta fold hydrolase [Ktedonobacterales bacterium]
MPVPAGDARESHRCPTDRLKGKYGLEPRCASPSLPPTLLGRRHPITEEGRCNGPPLVLGHGITDSSDVFYERGYVAALKPTYRLVLIDARRYGQSDKPHDPPSYSPEMRSFGCK